MSVDARTDADETDETLFGAFDISDDETVIYQNGEFQAWIQADVSYDLESMR
ncbi:hypothetical protein [Haloarchaeobius sp. TZWWS8]|uniref:hypothetical protein n=1 Tax=Haloarchaeobius sp. TZWWS8 TaxID=3446121 RepID=UPI003EBF7630